MCVCVCVCVYMEINWRRQWHPTPVLLPGKIPWKEEPGGLQSMGSLRVGHDWATSLSLFTFHFHALEKEMATHSSVLAWRIPGMREPGGLPSMGLHRVRHDWSDLAVAAAMEINLVLQNWAELTKTALRLYYLMLLKTVNFIVFIFVKVFFPILVIHILIKGSSLM